MPPEPLESSRARVAGPPSLPDSARDASSTQNFRPQELRARPGPHGRHGRNEGPARLEALLNDLGAQVRRGAPPRREPTRVHPTGLVALDALLSGGFPSGCISEISGPASSGRTAIALALLAETTEAQRELAAVVDPADAFDPCSAEATGVDLDRVLWARPRGPLEALRCTERLMETGGIPLVLLDLGPPSPTPSQPPGRTSCPTPRHPAGSAPRSGRHAHAGRRRPGAGTAAHAAAHARPALHHWIRLARLAQATHTTLVVLSRERLTGSQATFALETRGFPTLDHSRPSGFAPSEKLGASRAALLGQPIEASVSLERAPGSPTGRVVRLHLATEFAFPDDPDP